jgi:hypothetical protein
MFSFLLEKSRQMKNSKLFVLGGAGYVAQRRPFFFLVPPRGFFSTASGPKTWVTTAGLLNQYLSAA